MRFLIFFILWLNVFYIYALGMDALGWSDETNTISSWINARNSS